MAIGGLCNWPVGFIIDGCNDVLSDCTLNGAVTLMGSYDLGGIFLCKFITYLSLFQYGKCVTVESWPLELCFQEFEEFSFPSVPEVSMVAKYSAHLLRNGDVWCGGSVLKSPVQEAV